MTTSSEKTLALQAERSRLERRANAIRARLIHTIDVLETRRHRVEELAHHAKRLAVPALASLLGATALAVGTAFAIRALVEHRRERRLGYRINKALAPFRREVRPPLWKEALRKVAMTAIGIIATETVTRGTRALLDGPRSASSDAPKTEQFVEKKPTPLLGA